MKRMDSFQGRNLCTEKMDISHIICNALSYHETVCSNKTKGVRIQQSLLRIGREMDG